MVEKKMKPHRYYRTNKIFLKTIGQWPHQTIRVRRSLLAVIILMGSIQVGSQLTAIVNHHDDWEFLLECASPLIFGAALATKLTCIIWNSQTMSKLLNRIRTDWQVWSHDREVNIIHKYAAQGRMMTVVYAVTILSTCILFTTQPIIPKIIDVLLKNGSETGEFAVPVDYYHLDVQEYYFYVSVYSILSVTAGAFITIAVDTMFIITVQHGCGLFAAVGPQAPARTTLNELTYGAHVGDHFTAIYNNRFTKLFRHKVQRTGNNQRSTRTGEAVYASNKRDMDMRHLVSCITRHNDAIEYTKLIEATYSSCLFFSVGFNMLIISISGFQILKTAKNSQESARYVAVIVANVGHLYMDSWMSQTLMDCSDNIRYSIHNGKWYKLSRAAQKSLVLMTMRCNVPCNLTAGKICTMSIKSFVTFIHTSLSYFTVLRSM